MCERTSCCCSLGILPTRSAASSVSMLFTKRLAITSGGNESINRCLSSSSISARTSPAFSSSSSRNRNWASLVSNSFMISAISAG